MEINPGVSFGIEVPSGLIYLALILVGVKFCQEREQRMPLGLIMAGGVSNLLSRIMYGGVGDYLSWGGVLYNNLADYLIVFGVVWYGFRYFVRRRYTVSDR